MAELTGLEKFQALADEALKVRSLLLRQKRAGEILSEALKHLTREEFQELQDYVFVRLEK